MMRPTFIVAALCLLGVAIEAKPTTRCTEKAADIMFVLDSSSSIWIVDYKKQLKFVADLVESFGVGRGNSKVRIGAITYSNQAHLDFSLDRYTDPSQLKNAILNIPHRHGNTNTAAALNLLKEQVEPNLKNNIGPTIAIVITDGKSMDPVATKEEAKKLHQLGINVYAIGVGNSRMYDINELKSISSDPDNNVYTVSSYSALKKIRQTFSVHVCEEEPTPSMPSSTTTSTTAAPTTTTTEVPTTTATTFAPTTRQPAPEVTTTVEKLQKDKPEYPPRDESTIIIFGYDLIATGVYGSGMIQQFINTILPYSGYGHFGVVSYGYCPTSFNVPITSLMNLDPSRIGHSIVTDGKLPDLVDVVREMKNILQTRSKQNIKDGRTEKQVAVLFVDPSFTKITPELIKEIEMLKKNGVELYLVNIGPCPWPQPEQLYSMSSQPHHNYIFNAPSYHQLVLRAQHNPFHFRPMYNQYTPSIPKHKTNYLS